jgi:hypothetical protein
MKPIQFIQPSQLYYWEKCPLKAVFSEEFRSQPIFPKHPDSDLGDLIHLFFKNKKEWGINSEESFERVWIEKIQEIDNNYLTNKLQTIYFPIKWSSKYYAVKKTLLKKSILKETKPQRSNLNQRVIREEWRDDKKNIGGKIDYMVLNENDEVIEIADIKTGKIFEFKNKEKVIKQSYKKQIQLYAYIIRTKQDNYPKCFIKDIVGNKYPVQINEETINEEVNNAIALKNKINKCIEESDYRSLANPDLEHCYTCDYRPVCDEYKVKYINNFDNKRVDIFGDVIEISGSIKRNIRVKIDNKIILLKGIICSEEIDIGNQIYVYNLFCPEGDTEVLYALKETILKNK